MPTLYRFAYWLTSFLLALCLTTGVHAQLNESCTVSILNRTAQVKPDGTWIAINVPANFGQVRARATCVENGVTRSGQSDLFTIPANGSVTLSEILLDAADPIPESLTLSAPTTNLATAGATTQLTVTARFPDGSTKNVSASSTGTSYTNSNSRVATVSADGLVTAVSSGTVIISALNEGALGLIQIRVTLSGGDADGDGIPDDIETASGLNPNDPTDGFADPDGDGLTNKQELVDFGTNPQVADSDGDTIADGASGLQIIDVSNPQAPTLLGTVDTPDAASGVDVDLQRNLAVVADGATGIRVIDIADVAQPTIVGSIDTGTAADVAVRDGFVFVADGVNSFTSVDLSDSQNPVVRPQLHGPPAVYSLLSLWLDASASAQMFSLLTACRLSISASRPIRFRAQSSTSAPLVTTTAQGSLWTARLCT